MSARRAAAAPRADNRLDHVLDIGWRFYSERSPDRKGGEASVGVIFDDPRMSFDVAMDILEKMDCVDQMALLGSTQKMRAIAWSDMIWKHLATQRGIALPWGVSAFRGYFEGCRARDRANRAAVTREQRKLERRLPRLEFVLALQAGRWADALAMLRAGVNAGLYAGHPNSEDLTWNTGGNYVVPRLEKLARPDWTVARGGDPYASSRPAGVKTVLAVELLAYERLADIQSATVHGLGELARESAIWLSEDALAYWAKEPQARGFVLEPLSPQALRLCKLMHAPDPTDDAALAAETRALRAVSLVRPRFAFDAAAVRDLARSNSSVSTFTRRLGALGVDSELVELLGRVLANDMATRGVLKAKSAAALAQLTREAAAEKAAVKRELEAYENRVAALEKLGSWAASRPARAALELAIKLDAQRLRPPSGGGEEDEITMGA